jgi:hypothetical protein
MSCFGTIPASVTCNLPLLLHHIERMGIEKLQTDYGCRELREGKAVNPARMIGRERQQLGDDGVHDPTAVDDQCH